MYVFENECGVKKAAIEENSSGRMFEWEWIRSDVTVTYLYHDAVG